MMRRHGGNSKAADKNEGENTAIMSDTRADWPQIGDITPGHDGGRPDPTDKLAGRELALSFADGRGAVRLAFASAGELEWEEMGSGERTREACQVFEVRPGLYFLDLVRAAEPRRTVSAVLALEAGSALLIEAEVPAPAEARVDLLTRLEKQGSQSAVRVAYHRATIEGAGAGATAEAFPRTADLVGKRLRYVYSASHVYEHIYLSEKYYCWYCWRGPDAGLGDFEECDYFKLADDLYLVCWREKLLPCLAVMIEDHRAMRSLGKVFGADAYSGATDNQTVGARMTLLNETPPFA